MKKSLQRKKRSRKLSKKGSRASPKKRTLDGVGDFIKVIVKDIGGVRYDVIVNEDGSVQSILDGFKCELVKKSKWPINENEYKYILKLDDGRVLELDQMILDAGIGNESTIIINTQKIKHHEELYSKIENLEKKVLELEGDFNQKIEKTVQELQAFNWLGYFGFPLERYNGYYGNQQKVSAETIISAFEIMKKSKSLSRNDLRMSSNLFQIIRNMNDENLEKLIPFLIDNNIGISTGKNILKFNDPDFLRTLKIHTRDFESEFFDKIQRVMAKIH
jgi:hypothetical protein